MMSFVRATLKQTTTSIGLEAEEAAYRYLKAQGLILLHRNFRGKMGEIDLVMKDGDYLVFVEVRKRKHSAFGGAIASITRQKQQKIIKTAMLYLTMHRLHGKIAARFDVVLIDAPNQITWLKNAFDSDGA